MEPTSPVLTGNEVLENVELLDAVPGTDQETSVVLAGVDAEQDTSERVAELRGIVDELAGLCSTLSEHTRDFVRHGGSIDKALEEINELRAGQQQTPLIDAQLEEAREDYASVLTKRRGLLHPRRKGRLQAAQASYKEALTAKIEATTDLRSDSEAEEGMSVEDLVERGLKVLTSTLLKEEQSLRETVNESKQGRLINRMASSPALYRSVLGGLVASSILLRSGIIAAEGDMEHVTHTAEMGIEGLAAFGFASVTQEKLFKRINSRWAAKQLMRSEVEIKKDEAVADDLIERTASGVDKESGQLGGARLLAGRLFSNHLEELKQLDQRETSSIEVEYAKLIKHIVSEEIKRATQGIVASERHTAMFRGLSLVGALIAGPIIANVGVAAAATSDLEKSLKQTV